MAFVFCAHRSNELCIRITQKAYRIRIQRNMRSAFLAIAGDSLEKFLSLLGRLDADTKDMHFSFEIAFPLVTKAVTWARHQGHQRPR